MRISGVVAAGLALAAGVEAHTKPDVINLPQGFFPEGTANGRGWTIYVGSFGGRNRHRLCCVSMSGRLLLHVKLLLSQFGEVGQLSVQP